MDTPKDIPNYYQILGVDEGATQEEIKRAYRKLARKYHPDVSEEADAESRFKKVGEAYETLKDPKTREEYDQILKFGEANGSGDWQFQYSGEAGAEQFGNFFKNFFGEDGFSQPRAHSRSVYVQLPITLEQLAGLEPIEIELPGRKRQQISLPPDIRDGETLMVGGQADPGVLATIRVIPHPEFRLDGKDIHTEVTLQPWEAVLGTKKRINLLGGQVDLKIPAGTSSGKKLKLRGKGLAGRVHGDHFVEVKIEVPTDLDADTRALYEKLRALDEETP